jgi:hypothetical protein
MAKSKVVAEETETVVEDKPGDPPSTEKPLPITLRKPDLAAYTVKVTIDTSTVPARLRGTIAEGDRDPEHGGNQHVALRQTYEPENPETVQRLLWEIEDELIQLLAKYPLPLPPS